MYEAGQAKSGLSMGSSSGMWGNRIANGSTRWEDNRASRGALQYPR